MAQTYKKEKVESLIDMIQIFLDDSNEKMKSNHYDSAHKRYLLGQCDAYKMILKIIEKDFGLPAGVE
ncbi:hypothetical protein [Bacillus sp. FJAT-29814]|uniref:hypothetical protein n=1 Tax=Bacillus sp. FJAT-29814 TaxID=1729688 RepID=UPI00082F519C|nr:hypothetical protein [Bacillus sp. FJAT-29814]